MYKKRKMWILIKNVINVHVFLFSILGNNMKLFSFATQSENKLLKSIVSGIIDISSIM